MHTTKKLFDQLFPVTIIVEGAFPTQLVFPYPLLFSPWPNAHDYRDQRILQQHDQASNARAEYSFIQLKRGRRFANLVFPSSIFSYHVASEYTP